MLPDDPPCGFVHLGPERPLSPVVIAVPHAGRSYPDTCRDDAADMRRLVLLEDRHADLLASAAVRHGATAFVATRARAWIDLNRDPREIDPAMIEGRAPPGIVSSPRVRNGLGLVPRRIGAGPDLWRRKFTADDLLDRIETVHRPYHDALALTLAETRQRFGVAILLDCHSMPPLGAPAGRRPNIVIGDRYGRSAAASFGDALESLTARSGLRPARNTPYAGGYTLDRHGAPRAGIHALQVEVDRSLYLDPALVEAGAGVAKISMLISQMHAALAMSAAPAIIPEAAE